MMKRFMLGVAMAIGLAGCSATEKGVTVEPYNLKGMEETLVSQTQVDSIDYFMLNGKTGGLDLKYSVEVYEKGKLVDELFQSRGLIEENYKSELISFGLHNGKELELFVNTVGGTAMANGYPAKGHEEMASTYGSLIEEKITLTKDQPAYIAIWAGTKGNMISTLHGENGGLPDNLAQYDRAFLFKLELLDPDSADQ